MKSVQETVKFVIRIAILGAPYWGAFVADWHNKGLMAAIAGALLVLDKLVHETDRVPLKGLLPF